MRLLTTSMAYEVPSQDLRIDMAMIPAVPASGFVIANVTGSSEDQPLCA